MNALFCHKGNWYTFNVDEVKRKDGMTAPPDEAEFKGHKLELKGVQEKKAFYEVKKDEVKE